MKTNKRNWTVIIIGIVGAIACASLDYTENGLSLSLFAWPVLILGSILIPSLIDIFKNNNRDA